jgi:hypothetical protein
MVTSYNVAIRITCKGEFWRFVLEVENIEIKQELFAVNFFVGIGMVCAYKIIGVD